MPSQKYIRIIQPLLILSLVITATSCNVYMNDFPRKKYKIKENGTPVVQRYYDKHDIFNPYKHKQRKKARRLKRRQLDSRRITPKKKATHGQPFPEW